MTTRFATSLILLLGMPFAAGASTFVGTPPDQTVGVGQLAAFTLFLNTEGESVNALDGTVSYDAEKLTFKSVADGDSVVTVWLKKLAVTRRGELSFSGVIPGGFTGGQGKLLTLYFTAREPGENAMTALGDAYLDDGKGTSISVKPLNSSITIVKEPVANAISEADIEDVVAPITFKPA